MPKLYIGTQTNFLYFVNTRVAELSKIGHILGNKVPLELKLAKNANSKKCAHKLTFFNEKKSELLRCFLTLTLKLRI